MTLSKSLKITFSPRPEKLVESRYPNLCFLMAQNDVSRYTLGIFHTFALLQKIQKRKNVQEQPKIIFLAAEIRQGCHRSDLFYFFGPIVKSYFSLIFRPSPEGESADCVKKRCPRRRPFLQKLPGCPGEALKPRSSFQCVLAPFFNAIWLIC